MPNTQLGDTETMSYSVTELDADSNPATPQAGDVATVTSSDTASATIVPDATPVAGTVASGQVVGGSKVQTGVQITASVTHADGTTLGPITGLVDVVGGAASSLGLTFGTPVAQTPTTPPATAAAARAKAAKSLK